ncbi:MAG TPA: pyridoxal phosphate-dependent aminotransferase [Accumulibacter sp.]|nr:pyridoxal phosphate-dependent aminotransferase [Accumulibacter sp.]HMW17672.1 pyridoxal phosphate-dependent aminotransferase [Accumulibacter sp.]HMX22080.1 pyridoxal phosphate-dependent aminotransferase [Accumulibacter sp.]HMY06160.1 pyridoxal phosphate-dependent aminotransferase [Accumulibacter sp.]HNC16574.1 pyridoxal phosphate-dependent aminotransferase [Accumulibacter sp.]
MATFPASRLAGIAPFHVMELLARAKALEAAGRDIIHMEVGEPDFPTPAPIVAVAQAQIASGRIYYTPALGLPALRQAIAGFYQQRYGVSVPAERVVVTAGASAALLLTMACLCSPGSEWLLSDPGYPCNAHFVRSFEGVPVAVRVRAEDDFQPTLATVVEHWTERSAGVLVASPANPTGTLIAERALSEIAGFVRQRGGRLIVDEIYHGLTYDCDASTALGCGDDLVIVQSFSKYFNMTGWRLGWLIVPENMVRDIEKLAQNLYISPSTPAQYAALAAFTPETTAILEERRDAFRRRRDFLAPALQALGFHITAKPDGAFYLYADCRHLCADSARFANELLDSAGVAVTPGLDFGNNEPQHYLRFAYTTDLTRLAEAVERIRRFLGG